MHGYLNVKIDNNVFCDYSANETATL